MTDRTPPTDTQLDDIAARAAHFVEYGGVPLDLEPVLCEDVPLLLAKVHRQRAELAARPAVLSDAERTMLAYALDQAQEHIWSRDGFTDEDQAAVTSLRRLAAVPPSGPVSVAVSAPQPDSGLRDAPDAPSASESRAGAPDAASAVAVSGGEQ